MDMGAEAIEDIVSGGERPSVMDRSHRAEFLGEQVRFTIVRGLIGPIILLLSLLHPAAELEAQQGRSERQRQGTQGAVGKDTAAARRLLQERGIRDIPGGGDMGKAIERLRASGLSRAEARARLEQMGYDPNLVDPYYDALESEDGLPEDSADARFLQGMRWIDRAPELIVDDTTVGPVMEGPDWLQALLGDSLGLSEPVEPELEIFGRSLFSRATSQFDPIVAGPASPDYRLGPGDEIVLVLTGDVELSYTLPVSPEGHLFIPTVGEVSVNGLTLAELESVLYTRLGRVYSGVRRDESATTHFQVSLGKLRVNQVYLVGEVERPGAYWVSGASTVFDALYRAGGPNEVGSFRKIEVWRGQEVVRRVDLYDYLLHGDSRDDIRLEHGDLIFVPQYESHVRVEGAVRRPAIYEVAEGTGIRKLLDYAGGVRADAVLRRVQIDRIVPPSERRPGIDRTLIDVELTALEPDARGEVEVRDGDIVQVFAVSEERRNRVVLTGEVRRPGVYEWSEGMTLWQLVDRAEGLHERAYTPRGHIYRFVEEDGSRRLIRTPLLADSAGQPLQDMLLADLDSVVVLSRETLRNPETVEISGWVKHPGVYELAEGMRVEDLILAAGGFRTGALQSEVDLARVPYSDQRTEVTSEIYRISLTGELERKPGELKATPTGLDRLSDRRIPIWVPDPSEFELRDGDHLFVRKAPGYEEPGVVHITGEVLRPGEYVLSRRQERLLDLLNRAGGLTSQAYSAGLRVIREGNLVATDLTRALQDPESRFNLVLEPGDSLHLPQYDPTVLVTGAVTFESRILYVPGKGMDYYINRAGGYSRDADKSRVVVGYQDGGREAVRKFIFVRRKPAPEPGSTIFVPFKPESERGAIDWGELISRTTMVMSAVATLLVATRR